MAFLLDSDTLCRLKNLLTREVFEKSEVEEETPRSDRAIEYSIELTDGTSADTTDIEEILNHPNSSDRSISLISLSTPFSSREMHATVRFENKEHTPVHYDLRGEEGEVISLSSKLDEELQGMRQWHTILTPDRNLLAMLAFSTVLSIVLSTLMVSSLIFEGLRDALKASDAILIPFFVVAVLLTVLYLLLLLLGQKLFPIGTFAIGQGVRRHNRLNNIRKAILTVVLFPLLIGLLFELIP